MTKPVDFRITPSGPTVCDLTIANNRYNQGRQFTTYVRVTLWGKQAEWAKDNLNAGDTVSAQGTLVDDNFEREGHRTTGRLKINKANVNLLKRASPKKMKDIQGPPVETPVV
jgi:single-stranded DNA-binding protein